MIVLQFRAALYVSAFNKLFTLAERPTTLALTKSVPSLKAFSQGEQTRLAFASRSGLRQASRYRKPICASNELHS